MGFYSLGRGQEVWRFWWPTEWKQGNEALSESRALARAETLRAYLRYFLLFLLNYKAIFGVGRLSLREKEDRFKAQKLRRVSSGETAVGEDDPARSSVW